jgi:thiol-disulfide isomerase/thioredoxin
MWERALELDNAYRTARFRYPEFFDKVKDPTNVGAVRLKRKKDKDRKVEAIKNFASEYDLVLFSKEECSFCKEFAPILKSFCDEYGFKIEEAAISGEISGLFPGGNFPKLAKKLGIKATPSIYAISKNKKQVFELMRGFVSKSELEEYAYIANNYVNL